LVGEYIDRTRSQYQAETGKLVQLMRGIYVYPVENIEAEVLGCATPSAWYAAAELDTAIVEVAHHLRREAAARSTSAETRTYRAYTCVLEGSYLDIRGKRAERGDLYERTSYAASQLFGEAIRSARAMCWPHSCRPG